MRPLKWTKIEANKDVTEFNIYQVLIRNGKIYWGGNVYKYF